MALHVDMQPIRLRICGIEPESIVDGPGFRFVIFVQGCPHHCPGCHNPQSHPWNGGACIDARTLLPQIAENPLLSGVTFSGGEPFGQAEALAELAAEIKPMGKNLFVYTGFTLEQLAEQAQTNAGVRRLLQLTDTLVDSPYVEAQRDLTLLYRGSANQRLLSSDEIARALEQAAHVSGR